MGNAVNLTGMWICRQRNKDGILVKEIRQKNILLNTGKERIAKLIGGLSTDGFYTIAIGVGTSTEGPRETDVELFSLYKSGGATRSYVADFKCQFYYQFSFSDDVTITECGIRRSTTYLNHTMFEEAISLTSGDTLDVFYTITVS